MKQGGLRQAEWVLSATDLTRELHRGKCSMKVLDRHLDSQWTPAGAVKEDFGLGQFCDLGHAWMLDTRWESPVL